MLEATPEHGARVQVSTDLLLQRSAVTLRTRRSALGRVALLQQRAEKRRRLRHVALA